MWALAPLSRILHNVFVQQTQLWRYTYILISNTSLTCDVEWMTDANSVAVNSSPQHWHNGVYCGSGYTILDLPPLWYGPSATAESCNHGGGLFVALLDLQVKKLCCYCCHCLPTDLLFFFFYFGLFIGERLLGTVPTPACTVGDTASPTVQAR